MAYLRGNSVVDGNLYVEGDLFIRNVRPEEEGAIITYKKDGAGVDKGRHLRVDAADTGALIDSSITEIINNDSTDNTKKVVGIYIDTQSNPSSQTTSNVLSFTVNYPIEKVWVIDKDKTGDANVNFGQLTALKDDGTAYADYKKFPERIKSWGYV